MPARFRPATRCATAVVAISLSLIVTVAACGGTEHRAPPPAAVKIGILAPTTGPNAVAGREATRGAQLAVDLVNSTSDPFRPFPAGLFGAGGASRLVLVPADTGSNRQRGVDETARLVATDRVAGIVGAFDPDVTLDVSQRAERLSTPFVSGDVALSALTQGGLDWFFRTSPDARGFGRILFSLIGTQSGDGSGTRIAVLHADDSTGNDLAATMREFADEAGQQIVSDTTYAAGSNLSPELDQIQSTNPDVLYFVAIPGATDVLASALNRSDFHPKAVIVHGDSVSTRPSGASFDGIAREVAWSSVLAARNPRASAAARAYQQRYGSPMTEEAASSFTAVTTLAYAIQNAGGADPGRIRTALLALHLPGEATIMPWTGIGFDGSHQNTLANSVIEQATGGQVSVVYPRDLATTNFRWGGGSTNN